MNIIANMEMLRHCRLDDVLKWIQTECPFDEDVGAVIHNILNTKEYEITIPLNQYTASVIARACDYHYSHYWHIKYRPDIDILICCDNPNDINSDDTIGCYVNPDPINNTTEWNAEWIEQQLKEIHS